MDLAVAERIDRNARNWQGKGESVAVKDYPRLVGVWNCAIAALHGTTFEANGREKAP